jgi:hypothetical protein
MAHMHYLGLVRIEETVTDTAAAMAIKFMAEHYKEYGATETGPIPEALEFLSEELMFHYSRLLRDIATLLSDTANAPYPAYRASQRLMVRDTLELWDIPEEKIDNFCSLLQ